MSGPSNKLLNASKLIMRLEAFNIRIGQIIASLLAIIFIRNLLENSLEASNSIVLHLSFYLLLCDYVHITISWACVFFSIVAIVSVVSRKGIYVTTKMVLFVFPVIIIVPLIDHFIFDPGNITYQNSFDTLIFSYFHLFNPNTSISYVTAGVRIEILFAIIGSAFYIYTSTSSIIRSIFGAICVYSTVFLYGYLPAIYSFVFSDSAKNIIDHATLYSHSPVQFHFLLYVPVILFLATIIMSCLLSQRHRRAILVTIRLKRLSIYVLIMLFGLAVGSIEGLAVENLFNKYDILKIVCAVVSISCAFIYSTILNDIYDYDIDIISNRERPLVQNDIEVLHFNEAKNVMLFLAIALATPINEVFVFVLLFIIALSYLYSSEPFRLKRVYPVGHIMLGLIAISSFILGVCMVDGTLAYRNSDPRLIATIFVIFVIASQLKDVKDHVGDSTNGIITLSTIIGPMRAYVAISVAVSLVLFGCGLILGIQLVPVLICTASFIIATVWLRDSEKLLIMLQCCLVYLFANYIYTIF